MNVKLLRHWDFFCASNGIEVDGIHSLAFIED